jgi:hypothetical protein
VFILRIYLNSASFDTYKPHILITNFLPVQYVVHDPRTVQKEEPVRLILLMQREKILYLTDTIDVASFLADFYV